MWRFICIAMFLFAGLHFTSDAMSQTDTPSPLFGISCEGYVFVFEREKCDAAKVEAAERGISVEQVLTEAEAAERGFTVEELLAERKAEREAAQAQYEKERAEADTRVVIILAVAATAVIALAVVLIKTRRRIAASLSRRWRKRSKDFRVWAFGSFFWAFWTLLFVWLFEPFGGFDWDIDDEDFLRMLGVMMVPPLFFGALWFGYKRFVK